MFWNITLKQPTSKDCNLLRWSYYKAKYRNLSLILYLGNQNTEIRSVAPSCVRPWPLCELCLAVGVQDSFPLQNCFWIEKILLVLACMHACTGKGWVEWCLAKAAVAHMSRMYLAAVSGFQSPELYLLGNRTVTCVLHNSPVWSGPLGKCQRHLI